MPLDSPQHIVALAGSVILGGAAGLRIEGAANIAAVRRVTDRPIIGLMKVQRPGTEVYITPTVADVEAVIDAGADIVAFDATDRPRPGSVEKLCAVIRKAGRLSMADVSTAAEGHGAILAGADVVSTTMSGYTPYSPQIEGPDFDLMAELCALRVPFVSEGRVWTADDARRCFELGATFIVVGSAITRPDMITRRLIEQALGAAPDAASGSIVQ